MKKLFTKALLFGAIYFAIATPLDFIISKEMRNIITISSENEVWNDIYDKKINERCLIYGSSRAKTHIDPDIIERETGVSTYNFGSNGQPFVINKVRHNVNIKLNGRPQYIIHSLDAFGLAIPHELFDSPQFLPHLLWDMEMIRGVNVALTGFTYADYFIPLARYYGQLDRIHTTFKQTFEPNSNFRPQRIKGYTPVYLEWNTDLDKAKEDNEYFRAIVHKEACDMYEDFIKECQTHGTKLAMVYTPEHVEGQEYIINHDSIVAIYQHFSEKYHVPFINYTKDTICKDKQYFYNSMHLNAKGSKLITEQLTRDLKAIRFFDD